jgi:hypothetical protein
MLILAKDWRVMHGGAVANHLFLQLPQTATQTVFARHLVGAALELAIAGIFQQEPAPQLEEWPYDLRWQIRDCIYSYVPEIDNGTLPRVIGFGKRLQTVTLIVPQQHDQLLWRLCQETLSGRTPMIQSLDTFISLRTLFSSWDFGWPIERVVWDLLRRFNRRAVDACCDESILVDIPLDFT